MDLKALALFLCLSALAITSAEGGIPKCCVRTMRKISKQMLWKVETWGEQQSTGACDIKALILYVKGRKTPICAAPNPKVKRRLKYILKMKRKRKLETGAKTKRP